MGAIVINASHQEGDTIGAGHRFALGAFVALTEVDGKIADSFSYLFNCHWLSVVESVVLRLDSGVVNQDASVSDDATHSASAMSVNLYTAVG